MFGVCRDVTARKEDEVEVLRMRADLAHAGRVSTMAQLASSLAHELNQPLGAILRNAEAAEVLLQSNPPDLDEVRAILADICSDDHRAGEVIDHMRALLKRRGLEHVQLHVAELVDEVVALVQPDATSRKVRLGVDIPKALPPMRGDRVHLQQVLLNLILNGMDAMTDVPAEGRCLVVRARQADAATIEVAIADAGHGIPDAKLARLFEPFVTTKPEGLGLGLPISATIIGAHGGRIWAESGPAGATFYFTVPVSSEA
jgi:C4-dicarboxylate-specific signal transduction histidine kinase